MGTTVPLKVAAKTAQKSISTCVKTASGFGGCNAAIVLSKQPDKGEVNAEYGASYHTVRECKVERATITVDREQVFASEAMLDFPTFIREAYKTLGESGLKFYKMDDLAKLAYLAAEFLLKDIPFEPNDIGIVLANSSASLATDIRHQHLIDKGGDAAASPSVFVYTLPNVAAGEVCIRHKIQGESTFFVAENYDSERLERYARIAMQKQHLTYCIVGWCDFIDNHYIADFKLIQKVENGRADIQA